MPIKVHLLHIPKTGGISLYRALQGAGVDVTRSHDPDQMPAGALVVTLLRNPVDRVWSVYRYQKRQGWFDGSLSAFLQQTFDPWWWGVRNIQARYMRPDVLVGLTDRLPCTLQRVCALVGVEAPTAIEWHGKDDGEGYTPQQYAHMAVAVGAEDMTLYGLVERG